MKMPEIVIEEGIRALMSRELGDATREEVVEQIFVFMLDAFRSDNSPDMRAAAEAFKLAIKRLAHDA